MYYLSNISIIEAIQKLHGAGTHEYFRTYLILKAHGLKYGAEEYIPVTTGNIEDAVGYLLKVPGLADEKPFYNPFRNELMRADTGRGTVQTHVKKFLDEATKTKMRWLEGEQREAEQGRTKPWYVRFSAQYPQSLGRGEDGLADKDGTQITIDKPAFVLWMHRNGSWQTKPGFDKLWEEVKEKLNLHSVEIDLLFTKDSEFATDPFSEEQPNRDELVQFILQEEKLGSTREVLKSPTRPVFSEIKVQRIISSASYGRNIERWWDVRNLQQEAEALLDETRALLLVGPPGTGKTRLGLTLANKIVSNDETRIHRFQFHASFSYEDFIEALLPVPGVSILQFEPTLKRFALACENARTSCQVVILDEFNRADVAKVFGETFMLIERGYREEKYAIPHLHDSKRLFWVPPALYIIATLNNLDKSTYDIDFALRRRFGQVEVL